MQTTVKRSATVQAVLSRLRREIIDGVLRDGETVREVEFSERYGCSRAALRGAFAVLEQEGLLRVNPNGTKQISALTEKDIDDLYELRSFVECSAAAALCRSERPELFRLMQVLENARQDRSDGFFESDALFHETLVSLSGNKALIQTWRTLAPVTREVLAHNLELSHELADAFLQRHTLIVSLLVERDPKAVDALKHHIEEAHALSVQKERRI